MTPAQLDRTFAALADPTRRAIVRRLAAGETTVTELARPFAMSLPAISRHLRVLEAGGLIRQQRQAQFRFCRIDPGGLRSASEWIDFYRGFWGESFDRLDEHLQSSAKPPPAKTKAKTKGTTRAKREHRHR
jgi:DNA-binding transcriptional ArsR family regulator